MASPKQENAVDQFHPAFNSPNSDIVLRCRATLYRLPSYILRNTTTLLQQKDTSNDNLTVSNKDNRVNIVFDADEKVVERLLRLISGLETPRCESFDELEAAIALAERWGARGPLSVLRYAITSPMCLEEPIRAYGIACRYGWTEEARIASIHTLRLNLYSEDLQPALESVPSRDLLRLLHLHRRRRDEFQELIDTEDAFEAGNTRERFCRACGIASDNHTWRELKWRMIHEMDQRAMGDTIIGLEMEEWPEAIACWGAKCSEESCKQANYDKSGTLRAIKACIERLPASV